MMVDLTGKHGKRTQIIKMGADKSAENTMSDSKDFSPICLPKPKSLGFLKKKFSLGVRSPWYFVLSQKNDNCMKVH